MSKVMLWIPDDKLKSLDAYCVAHNVKRSAFIVEQIMIKIGGAQSLSMNVVTSGVPVIPVATVVNVEKLAKVKCDFCLRPMIGRYHFTVHDWEQGASSQLR